MGLTGWRPELLDNGHPPEVDDVVTEKRKRQRENRTKYRNIDSIVFVFKLATPIDLDRYPAIEFACTQKERYKKPKKL